MKKITRFLPFVMAATALLASAWPMHAQDYDDDLYYSPSKARKQKEERIKQQAAEHAAQLNSYNYTTVVPQGNQTYTVQSNMPLQVDVDTYNRRGGSYDYGDTYGTYAPQTDDFANTRRIERFHNSEVVEQTGDTELMQYYYSQPQNTNINITVVNDIDPWDSTWAWDMGTSWWRWRYGRPYWSYGWGYNPYYYSWGWGYDPFWSPAWSWGWGPSWSWSPAWNWGPSWGWGHAWLPPHHNNWNNNWNWGSNRPGAHRPHQPAYGNGTAGSSRPHSPSYAGSATTPSGSTRPGNMGRPTQGTTLGGNQAVRPPQTVPSASGNKTPSYTPSNNANRGRNNNGSSTVSPQKSNSNNSSSRNQNNSYNNNNNYNSNRGNSGSSFNRPGNSGFGGGGGSYGGSGGGGGASRGRGR